MGRAVGILRFCTCCTQDTLVHVQTCLERLANQEKAHATSRKQVQYNGDQDCRECGTLDGRCRSVLVNFINYHDLSSHSQLSCRCFRRSPSTIIYGVVIDLPRTQLLGISVATSWLCHEHPACVAGIIILKLHRTLIAAHTRTRS